MINSNIVHEPWFKAQIADIGFKPADQQQLCAKIKSMHLNLPRLAFTTFNNQQTCTFFLTSRELCVTLPFTQEGGTYKFHSQALLVDAIKKKLSRVSFLITREKDTGAEVRVWEQIRAEWDKYIQTYAVMLVPTFERSLIIQECFEFNGGDFATKIAHEVNRKDMLQLVVQLAHQMRYLHDNNIAHGDIKLLNILLKKVDRVWKAVMIDFGSASAVGLYNRCTTKIICPPEGWVTFKNEDRIINSYPRDVWGLGTVFEALLYPKTALAWDPKENAVNSAMDSILLHQADCQQALDLILKLMSKGFSVDNEDHVGKAIAGMLAFKPEDRPDASRVLSTFTTLLEQESDASNLQQSERVST